MKHHVVASGAVLAGTLLLAIPILELLLGGNGAAAVRLAVGSFGLALLIAAFRLHDARKEV